MFIALPCQTATPSPTNLRRTLAFHTSIPPLPTVAKNEPDNDEDDVFEGHTISAEGRWTGLRNFLRRLCDVIKYFLSRYVAVHEFRVDLKHNLPAFF